MKIVRYFRIFFCHPATKIHAVSIRNLLAAILLDWRTGGVTVELEAKMKNRRRKIRNSKIFTRGSALAFLEWKTRGNIQKRKSDWKIAATCAPLRATRWPNNIPTRGTLFKQRPSGSEGGRFFQIKIHLADSGFAVVRLLRNRKTHCAESSQSALYN